MKKQIFSKVFLGLFIIGLSSIIISNHVFLPLVQRLANLCFNAASTNNFNAIRIFEFFTFPSIGNVFYFVSFFVYFFAFLFFILHICLSKRSIKGKIFLSVLIVISFLSKTSAIFLSFMQPMLDVKSLLFGLPILNSLENLLRLPVSDIIAIYFYGLILLMNTLFYFFSLAIIITYFITLQINKKVKISFVILLSLFFSIFNGINLLATGINFSLWTLNYLTNGYLFEWMYNLLGKGTISFGEFLSMRIYFINISYRLASLLTLIFCLICFVYTIVYTIIDLKEKPKLIVAFTMIPASLIIQFVILICLFIIIFVGISFVLLLHYVFVRILPASPFL